MNDSAIVTREPAALLSHSIPLEYAVLNASLEWGRVVPGIDAADFFRDANAVTAAAIIEAQRGGLSTEYPVIRQVLRERGHLEHVGEVYLKDLASNGVRPTESSLASNVVQLKALARSRRVAELILRSASNPSQIDVDALVRDLETLHIASGVGIKASWRTAKEVAEAADRVEWVVRGYIALGAITELTGKAKVAGKTTLIASIVACILDGTMCLGDRARKAPVVFLTEQTSSTFREVLRRAGLLHRDDLSILSYWDVKSLPWPTIVEMVGQEADRIGADVIVVDTLAQFAGIKGDGENNSGDASDALAPLQQQAHRGKALLVSRHARKSGGEVGEDGRGSSAFTGGVDIVLSLKRLEGNQKPTLRVIEGLSRFDETPTRLVVEKVSAFCSSLGIEVWAESFQVLGDTEAVATDAAKAGIERHLPTSETAALSLKDLEERTGSDRAALQRALKSITEIKTTGKGKKGDPLRYFRPEGVSAQTSIPKGLNEQNPEGSADGYFRA